MVRPGIEKWTVLSLRFQTLLLRVCFERCSWSSAPFQCWKGPCEFFQLTLRVSFYRNCLLIPCIPHPASLPGWVLNNEYHNTRVWHIRSAEKGFLEKCRWLFCGFEISVGEAFRPSNWPDCRGWKASITDREYNVSTIRLSRSGKTHNPVLHLYGITGFSGDSWPFQVLFSTRGWKKESGSRIYWLCCLYLTSLKVNGNRTF